MFNLTTFIRQDICFSEPQIVSTPCLLYTTVLCGVCCTPLCCVVFAVHHCAAWCLLYTTVLRGVCCGNATMFAVHHCAAWCLLWECHHVCCTPLCCVVFAVGMPPCLLYTTVLRGVCCGNATMFAIHHCAAWCLLWECHHVCCTPLCCVVFAVGMPPCLLYTTVLRGVCCRNATMFAVHHCAVWCLLWECHHVCCTPLCCVVFAVGMPPCLLYTTVLRGVCCRNATMFAVHHCAAWCLLWECHHVCYTPLCCVVFAAGMPPCLLYTTVLCGVCCGNATMFAIHHCAAWCLLQECHHVCCTPLCCVVFAAGMPPCLLYTTVLRGVCCGNATMFAIHHCAAWCLLQECHHVCYTPLCCVVFAVGMPPCLLYTTVLRGVCCGNATMFVIHHCAAWCLLQECHHVCCTPLCCVVFAVGMPPCLLYTTVLRGVCCRNATMFAIHHCAVWCLLWECHHVCYTPLCCVVFAAGMPPCLLYTTVLRGVCCGNATMFAVHHCAAWCLLWECHHVCYTPLCCVVFAAGMPPCLLYTTVLCGVCCRNATMFAVHHCAAWCLLWECHHVCCTPLCCVVFAAGMPPCLLYTTVLRGVCCGNATMFAVHHCAAWCLLWECHHVCYTPLCCVVFAAGMPPCLLYTTVLRGVCCGNATMFAVHHCAAWCLLRECHHVCCTPLCCVVFAVGMPPCLLYTTVLRGVCCRNATMFAIHHCAAWCLLRECHHVCCTPLCCVVFAAGMPPCLLYTTVLRGVCCGNATMFAVHHCAAWCLLWECHHVCYTPLCCVVFAVGMPPCLLYTTVLRGVCCGNATMFAIHHCAAWCLLWECHHVCCTPLCCVVFAVGMPPCLLYTTVLRGVCCGNATMFAIHHCAAWCLLRECHHVCYTPLCCVVFAVGMPPCLLYTTVLRGVCCGNATMFAVHHCAAWCLLRECHHVCYTPLCCVVFAVGMPPCLLYTTVLRGVCCGNATMFAIHHCAAWCLLRECHHVCCTPLCCVVFAVGMPPCLLYTTVLRGVCCGNATMFAVHHCAAWCLLWECHHVCYTPLCCVVFAVGMPPCLLYTTVLRGVCCGNATMFAVHHCAAWCLLRECHHVCCTPLCCVVFAVGMPPCLLYTTVLRGVCCGNATMFAIHHCAAWCLLRECHHVCCTPLCCVVFAAGMPPCLLYTTVLRGVCCGNATMFAIHHCAVWCLLRECHHVCYTPLCCVVFAVGMPPCLLYTTVLRGVCCGNATMFAIHHCAAWCLLWECHHVCYTPLCCVVFAAGMPPCLLYTTVLRGVCCRNATMFAVHHCAVWCLLWECHHVCCTPLCCVVFAAGMPPCLLYTTVLRGVCCGNATMFAVHHCAAWCLLRECHHVCCTPLCCVVFAAGMPPCLLYTTVLRGVCCGNATMFVIHHCAAWCLLRECHHVCCTPLCCVVFAAGMPPCLLYTTVLRGVCCGNATMFAVHHCAAWCLLRECHHVCYTPLCCVVFAAGMPPCLLYTTVLRGVCCGNAN